MRLKVLISPDVIMEIEQVQPVAQTFCTDEFGDNIELVAYDNLSVYRLCNVCFQASPSNITESCGHTFCFTCLKNDVIRIMQRGPNASLLYCQYGCQVRRSKKFFTAFPPEVYEQFLKNKRFRYTESKLEAKETVRCPVPWCLGVVPVIPGAKSTWCNACDIRVCGLCYCVHHGRLPCQEAAAEPEEMSVLPFSPDEVKYIRCSSCQNLSTSLLPYPCGHVYCSNCFAPQIQQMAYLSPNQYASYRICCPQGCLIKRLTSVVKRMFPTLKTRIREIQQANTRLHKLQNGQAVPCLYCMGYVILYDRASYYRCEECRVRLCTLCHRKQHPGMLCEELVPQKTDIEELPFYSLDAAPRFSYCTLCTQPKLVLVTESCGHSYCRDCIGASLKNAFENLYSRAYIVLCPRGCRVTRSKSFFSFVGPEYYERYKLFKRMKFMRQKVADKEASVCPVPDCWGFIQIKKNLFSCDRCATAVCSECLRKEHPSLSCEEAFVESGDRGLAELAESQGWKACIVCKTYIERYEGCIHMTCMSILCQGSTEFCFICGNAWKGYCPCEENEEYWD